MRLTGLSECGPRPAYTRAPVALSAFSDRSHPPADDDLAATLGDAMAQWRRLVEHAGVASAVVPTWNFASASFGWSLRLLAQGRVLAYLTPQDGAFLFGVVLGDRVAAQACEGRIPKPLRAVIEAAPKYAEGRGIRFRVHTVTDARLASKLIDLKVGGARQPPGGGGRE